MAVTTFSIVAFLGRFVGTFTVSLESRNVSLALLEKKESTQYSSFLRVNSLAPFQEFTYQWFDDLYGGDENLDNENTDSLIGANYEDGNLKSLSFFKYTYYVKNVGNVSAKYNWSVNVVDDVASSDGRSLIHTLRVAVYEDGKKTVYGEALSKPHTEEGYDDYRAPISVDKDRANEEFPFMGYAEEFESSNVITTFRDQQIDIGETKRYTIVAWLEGFRSSLDEPEFAPRGATIKLGVEINAYENE